MSRPAQPSAPRPIGATFRPRVLLAGLVACLSCSDGNGVTQPATTPPPIAPAPSATVTNVAPTAQFAISPRWPAPGDTVTFDARYAHDGDGQVQRYRWTLGNGVSLVTSATARTVYRTAGTYTVALTTVDDSGDSTTTSMSLVVSSAGTPSGAVSATQSHLTLAAGTVTGGAAVVATLDAKTAAGVVISGANVGVAAAGRRIGLTPLSGTTNGSGVWTTSIGSSLQQTTIVRAVADYTALVDTVALTVTPAAAAAAGSVRLTQNTLASAGDSAFVEVIAKDTAGNPVSGAAVTLSGSPAGLVVSNEGTTDSDGKRIMVVKSTACATAHTITATVAGVAQSTAPTVTASAPLVYGICGATLWFDASDAATSTSSASIVTAWRDKSGYARHAAPSTGPSVVATGINGLTALRFDGVSQFVPITDVVGSTAYTVLFVGRRRSASAYFVGGTSGSNNLNFHFGYSGSTTARLGHTGNNLTATVTAFGSASAEPARVWASRWTSGARGFYIDGATMNTDATANGVTSSVGAAIGRRLTSFYGIDVGEVVFFAKDISDPERQAAERALMAKWGIGNLTITQGNAQSAAAGTSPALAPQVRITDAGGTGIPGATVVFEVTAGGGRVNGATTYTATTDASGYASVPSGQWIFDYGANSLTAWYGTAAGMGQSVVLTGTGTLPANLVMQYDANASTSLYQSSTCSGAAAAVGDSVGCWKDLTANVRHVTQTTTAARPTVAAFGSTGRNALKFVITRENYLESAATGLGTLANGPRTIVAVAKSNASEDNSTNEASAIVLFPGYHSGLTFHGYPTSNYISAPQWSNPSSTGALIEPGVPYTANTAIVASQVVTVSGGTFTSKVVMNGTSTWSESHAGTPSGYPNMMRVGQGNAGAASPYHVRLDGQIAEIMVFSRALTNTERAQVEHYMGWKWGVTVP